MSELPSIKDKAGWLRWMDDPSRKPSEEEAKAARALIAARRQAFLEGH